MRNIIVISENGDFKGFKRQLQNLLEDLAGAELSSNAATTTVKFPSFTAQLEFKTLSDINKQDNIEYFTVGSLSAEALDALKAKTIDAKAATPEDINDFVKQAHATAEKAVNDAKTGEAAKRAKEEAEREAAERAKQAETERLQKEKEAADQQAKEAALALQAEKDRAAEETAQKYNQSKDAVKAAELALAELQEQLKSKQAEVTAKEAAHKTATEFKGAYKAKHETLTQEFQSTQQAAQIADTDLLKAKEALNKAQARLASAKADHEGTEAALKTANTKLTEAKAKPAPVVAVAAAVGAVDPARADLEARLETATEALDDSQRKLAEAKNELDEKNSLRAEHAKNPDGTPNTSAKQKKKNAAAEEAQGTYNKVHSEVEGAEKAVAELTAQLNNYVAPVAAPAPAAVAVHPDVKPAEEEVLRLEVLLSAQAKTLTEAAALIPDLTKAVQEAEASHTAAVAKVAPIAKQITALESEFNTHDAVMIDFKTLNSDLSELKGKLTAQEKTLHLFSEQAEELRVAAGVAAPLGAAAALVDVQESARAAAAAVPVDVDDAVNGVLAKAPDPKEWKQWVGYRDSHLANIKATKAFQALVKGHMLTHFDNQLDEKHEEAEALLTKQTANAPALLNTWVKARMRQLVLVAQGKVLTAYAETANAGTDAALKQSLANALKKQIAALKDCDSAVAKSESAIKSLQVVELGADGKETNAYKLAKKIAALEYYKAVAEGRAGLALGSDAVDQGVIDKAIRGAAKGKLGASVFGKLCDSLTQADNVQAICTNLDADLQIALDVIASANFNQGASDEQKAEVKARFEQEFKVANTELLKSATVEARAKGIVAESFVALVAPNQALLAKYQEEFSKAAEDLAKKDGRNSPNPVELLGAILSESDSPSVILHEKRGIAAVGTPATISYLQELQTAVNNPKAIEIDHATKAVKLAGLSAELTKRKKPAADNSHSAAGVPTDPLLAAGAAAQSNGVLPAAAAAPIPAAAPEKAKLSKAPKPTLSWNEAVTGVLANASTAYQLDKPGYQDDKFEDAAFKAALKAELKKLFEAGIKKYQHQLSEVKGSELDTILLLNHKIDELDLALQVLNNGEFNVDRANQLAKLSKAIAPQGRLFGGVASEIARLKQALVTQKDEHTKTSNEKIAKLEEEIVAHDHQAEKYFIDELQAKSRAVSSAVQQLDGKSIVSDADFTATNKALSEAMSALDVCRQHFTGLHAKGTGLQAALQKAKDEQAATNKTLAEHSKGLDDLLALSSPVLKTPAELLENMLLKDKSSVFAHLSEHRTKVHGLSTEMRSDLEKIHAILVSEHAFARGDITLAAGQAGNGYTMSFDVKLSTLDKVVEQKPAPAPAPVPAAEAQLAGGQPAAGQPAVAQPVVAQQPAAVQQPAAAPSPAKRFGLFGWGGRSESPAAAATQAPGALGGKEPGALVL